MNRYVLILLILAPMSVSAAGDYPRSVDDIRTQQAQIRADVEARKPPYDNLSEAERGELLQRQAHVLKVIEGKGSTDDLTEQQQLDLFNSIEWIGAAARQGEDERMVCERRPVLGSNRRERVCKTAAQWREQREDARNVLDSERQ